MNIIIIEQNEITNDVIRLSDRRADHVRDVLHSSPGDTLKIGILNGPTGVGTVESINHQYIQLRLAQLKETPPARQIDLILALPRPIMLKRILTQAVTLGVDRIYLINANRVEKSFFQTALLAKENYLPLLIQGLEQAMITRMPEVSIHKRFRPFIEDILPIVSKNNSIKITAHPEARLKLHEVIPSRSEGNILLAVGPEGGWNDFEIEKFKQAGFQIFTMGPRILKVDTAIIALLSQIDIISDLRMKQTTLD